MTARLIKAFTTETKSFTFLSMLIEAQDESRAERMAKRHGLVADIKQSGPGRFAVLTIREP